MAGLSVKPSIRNEPARSGDRERRSAIVMVVIGLLWSIAVSRPPDDATIERDRPILTFDWQDLARRALATQSPTMSSSPAR